MKDGVWEAATGDKDKDKDLGSDEDTGNDKIGEGCRGFRIRCKGVEAGYEGQEGDKGQGRIGKDPGIRWRTVEEEYERQRNSKG